MSESFISPTSRDGRRSRRLTTGGVAIALTAAALALPVAGDIAEAGCPSGTKLVDGKCVGSVGSGGGMFGNHNESVLV